MGKGLRCLIGWCEGTKQRVPWSSFEELAELRAEGRIATIDIGSLRFQLKLGQEGTCVALAALETYRQWWVGEEKERGERHLFRSVI